MGTTDKQNKNSNNEVEKAAEIAIQKAQLNILRFIACTVLVASIPLVSIFVTDHFEFKQLKETVAIIQKVGWTINMQREFADKLTSKNSSINISVPSPKEIHEDHKNDN